MVSDMAMVLLVLGLIYVIMLGVGIAHTASRLFKKGHMTRTMKTFKAFYAFILIQIFLSDILYWYVFALFCKSA